RNLMTGMLVLLEESQEYRLVQELVLFKTAFIPELEEAIKHKKNNTANTISFIENIISEGIKCGEFRENTDAHAAAIAALGLFSGITSLWLFDTEAFSVKEYAERMIDIFIQGISA
ncbi:MAG TPA: TetR family transcriptional regulator C-terminal domain-containing protein, partial [Clostridia bacterium]|nr:TetR family transcriptional regulator C-terminal domain-containing protein [Clostridia bacterium]